MPTLAELYCAQTGCAPRRFRQRVFWRNLHWNALPLAPLLLLGDYFKADYELIDACGRATGLSQVYDEIREQPHDLQRQGWLRRRLKCRVSRGRLARLAAGYLP